MQIASQILTKYAQDQNVSEVPQMDGPDWSTLAYPKGPDKSTEDEYLWRRLGPETYWHMVRNYGNHGDDDS